MKVSRRQFLKASLAAGALVGVGGMGSLIMPRSAHAAISPQLAKWAFWPHVTPARTCGHSRVERNS